MYWTVSVPPASTRPRFGVISTPSGGELDTEPRPPKTQTPRRGRLALRDGLERGLRKVALGTTLPTMRPLFALTLTAAALLATACDGILDNSRGGERYALARIGNSRLPVPVGDEPYPLLVGDTLRFPVPEGESRLVLTRVRVYRSEAGETTRDVAHLAAERMGATLLLDTCPIEALCIASLVYAPLEFLFVGDSLVQQLPPGVPQNPLVFGRVR